MPIRCYSTFDAFFLVLAGTFSLFANPANPFQPVNGSFKIMQKINAIKSPPLCVPSFAERRKATRNPLWESTSEDEPSSSSSSLSNQEVADVDGQRRRQLLFSMLYGSATVVTSTTSTAEAAEESTSLRTDAETVGTDFQNADILKPPKDDREYKTYVLENGLRVLLCSDPSSNQAAAAMVGSIKSVNL